MHPARGPTESLFEFKAGIPPRALGVRVGHVGRREVVALGVVPASVRARLRARGAQVTEASSAAEALNVLAASGSEALLVDPNHPDAFPLVRAMKLAGSEAWRLAPAIVLPLPGDDEYAVIVRPPEIAFLERTRRVPIDVAALDLDVAGLLGAANGSWPLSC